MDDGQWTSLAIIVVCACGAIAAARISADSYGRRGVEIWGPRRGAIVLGCLVGMLALIVAQWLLAAVAPAVLG